jgi:hypothetical protein
MPMGVGMPWLTSDPSATLCQAVFSGVEMVDTSNQYVRENWRHVTN